MPSLKIEFTTDPVLQAKYLCFQARTLQLGKYSEGGFAVLPRLEPGNSQCVHFPKLPYTPAFWAEIETFRDYSLTRTPSPKLLQLASDLIRHRQSFIGPNLAADWAAFSPDFLAALNVLIPNFADRVGEIIFLITDTGTAGSFSKLQLQSGKWNFICTCRIDFPIQNVANIILQCLITATQSGYSDIGSVGWHKRNGITEFLTRHSLLKPFLTYEKSTLLTPKLHEESAMYLSGLGFSPASQLNPDVIKSVLSKSELQLFELLWQNRGVVVSFDEVADVLWGQEADEKYSLSAMAKVVESLRAKIRSVGISYPLVHTLRKRGYLLNI